MSRIKFYEKSYLDIDSQNITITVTDATATNSGQSYVDFVRNRNNETAWMTTGSDDAANTQIDIDMAETLAIDRLLIVKHNLKAYTIQYHNGSSYVDFSTAINETTNTKSTNEHIFTEVQASKIRIITTGTQVADDDKFIYQILICKSLGQLEGYPEIKKPVYSANKRVIKLLSGKSFIARQRGAFSCTLDVKNYNITADLNILESIYFNLSGVLVWVNAGDSDQFSREHISYRPEDIFLVQPTDEWTPEFYKSLYQSGIKFKMNLVEVVR
jgi:hypothetical protein